MEKQEMVSVVFDYTSFLGESCKKKWTFIEVFTSITPVFCLTCKTSIDKTKEPEDRLWEQAFNNLSAQSSDESNLISLVNLAKYEGIEELRLMMPYELDNHQIQQIIKHTNVKIHRTAPDEFTIKF